MKPPHRCLLPVTWWTQEMPAGTEWRCSCGTVRRLSSTYRPGNGQPRFVDVKRWQVPA